ncbi:MAG: hypothetical protein U0R19_12360 [Bryobacteraceae bacterium]
MKRIPLATVLACFCTLGASAQDVHQLASGLQFRAPGGWTVRTAQDAAALMPPNYSQENELYAVTSLPAKDLNDPQLAPLIEGRISAIGMKVKASGKPIAFQAQGGAGRLYGFDIENNGEQGRLLVFAVGLRAGGVACLIAGGTQQLLTARESGLVVTAASLNRVANAAVAPAASTSAAGTPLTQQWMQRLTDKKLVYMSSYNSGYGSGGYSSEKKLYLASNGSYAFRSSGSVSVYVPGASGSSASRDGQEGRWRVVEQDGQAMLELLPNGGNGELIRLGREGTKTFLNGTRWFVVGINE